MNLPRLGFQTIGHGTLIAFDQSPTLATDPWLDGDAGFGAWGLSHDVPQVQRDAVAACPWIWISQDSSDRFHEPSLDTLTRNGRTILLPDHYGGRMRDRLVTAGFDVTVLADGTWTQLSKRIRIMSISDPLQRATLLVDVGGRLLVDLNEARDDVALAFLRKTIASYETSYLLAATGHEAPFIRLVDDDGILHPPPRIPGPPGICVEDTMGRLGVPCFVPLACMKRHRRSDNVWANDHVVPILAHDAGSWLDADDRLVMPPFVHWDFETGRVATLDPVERREPVVDPAASGDDWSADLLEDEALEVATYLRSFRFLEGVIDGIDLTVGSRGHQVTFEARSDRRLGFRAPAASLIAACRGGRLAELLSAGFAEVRLSGRWSRADWRGLVPDVFPALSIAEASGARGPAALAALVDVYCKRGFTDLASAGVVGKALMAIGRSPATRPGKA